MGLIFRTESNSLAPLQGEPQQLPEEFLQAHKEFRDTILGTDPIFPCYFAAISEKKGSLAYAYLAGNDCYSKEALYSVLDEFFIAAQYLRPLPVLALFVRPDGEVKSLAEDESLFWRLVNSINATRDDLGSVEAELTDPRWVLKYKQTPIFVTGHSPAYKSRLSRYSSYCLTLVIQEKQNLRRIAQDDEDIAAIMTKIRSLVDKYDALPRSPLLGFYGTEGVFDWRQFWLPDSNDILDIPCKIKNEEA